MTGCCSHPNCGGRDCALCSSDDVDEFWPWNSWPEKKSREGYAPCAAPQLRAAPHDTATTRVALMAAFGVLSEGDRR